MTAPLIERLQAAVDHPSHFSDSQHAELHGEAIEALRVAGTTARAGVWVDWSERIDHCTADAYCQSAAYVVHKHGEAEYSGAGVCRHHDPAMAWEVANR